MVDLIAAFYLINLSIFERRFLDTKALNLYAKKHF